ncbi:MAG: C25 family cysteine peptidase [Myxococcota bacterium]
MQKTINIFLIFFIGTLVSCDFSNQNQSELVEDAGFDSNNNQDALSDTDAEDGGDQVDPRWYEPDPEGRVTENNKIDFTPEMIIISPESFAEPWKEYAAFRTIVGVKTKVVTLDYIQENYQGVDQAEKVRNYLLQQYQEKGLRFALMGGDASFVPYRRIVNEIYLDAQYSSNAPSQTYFSNLEVDFDADLDEIYGERGDDLSLFELRNPNLAVGRVPSGNHDEIFNYRLKAGNYVNAYNGRVEFPLLLSDIATTIPIVGDVDGAEGIETTVQEYFPSSFSNNSEKLYATATAVERYGGETGTEENIRQSMNSGFPLVFHNGHGSHGWFTNILSSEFIETLTNEIAAVFVTCACLAGNYADVATTSTFEGWSEQEPENDSAGELYINGLFGGIAYIGNVATGLGAFGGSQFLHAFFAGVFQEGITHLGEAFNYGRRFMSDSGWEIPVLPVEMTDDSEWWTHHAIILLGDPSIKLQVEQLPYLQVEIPDTFTFGYNEMNIVVKDERGNPLEGSRVFLYKVDDFYLEATTDQQGNAFFGFLPYAPRQIEVGVVHEGFHSFSSIILPE